MSRIEPRAGDPAVHELKIWPEFYALVLDGSKEFEVRKADRDFRPLDIVILNEYAPGAGYTGRSMRKMIGHVAVLDHIGCVGYVAFAIFNEPPEPGLSS